MKIAIGCDHGGFALKGQLLPRFIQHEVIDLGCFSEEPVDYPDIAEVVAEAVTSGRCDCGILLCGTGIGMSIAANKVSGIRAALCTDTYSARMAREHNNANIITVGARTIGVEYAWEIINAYLNVSFLGGIHETRVNLMMEIEKKTKSFPLAEDGKLINRLQKPKGRVDVVLDTDAFNECDDQYAIAYLLKSEDKVNVKALYAAPFDNQRVSGPAEGMEQSYREILHVLELMDRQDLNTIVYRGSEHFHPSETEPVISDAARDLAERAMNYTEEHPLYVVALGATTNVSSALLINPQIRDRIVVIWLGGCAYQWPHNRAFNLFQDVAGARILFGSGVALVQIPGPGVASTFTTSGPELKYWLAGKNKLCDYLIKRTEEYVKLVGGTTSRTATIDKAWSRPLWDVVPVAWLMDEELVEDYLEHSPIPEYNDTYSFDKRRHMIRYVYNVHRDRLLTDLFTKITS